MHRSTRNPTLEILTLIFYFIVITLFFGYLRSRDVSNGMGYYIKDGYELDGGRAAKLKKLDQLNEQLTFMEEEFTNLNIPPEEKIAAIMALEEELGLSGIEWTPSDNLLESLLAQELENLLANEEPEPDDEGDSEDDTSSSFDWY